VPIAEPHRPWQFLSRTGIFAPESALRASSGFDDAGARHWQLTLVSQPILPKTNEDLFAEQFEKIMALDAVFS
jgi:hypothetical protein